MINVALIGTYINMDIVYKATVIGLLTTIVILLSSLYIWMNT